MSSIRETAERIAAPTIGKVAPDVYREIVADIEQALRRASNRVCDKCESDMADGSGFCPTCDNFTMPSDFSLRWMRRTEVDERIRNERERAAKMLESRANELQAEWDAPPSVDNGFIVMTADTSAGYATWWGMNELRKRAAAIRKDD